MNKTVSMLALIILFAFAIFMLAPDSKIEMLKAQYREFIDDPGQICFNEHSDHLKDPYSAQVISSLISNDRVLVKYRAKNSYGSFRTAVFDCPLKDGKVDKLKMLSDEVDELLGRKL